MKISKLITSLNTIKAYLNCTTNFNFNKELEEIEDILKKAESIEADIFIETSKKICNEKREFERIKCPTCGSVYTPFEVINFCTLCGQRLKIKECSKC